MSFRTLPFGPDRVLTIARGQIGTTENPPGSNRTRFGAETGLNGQPWCASFLGWCFQQAGGDLGEHLGTSQWRYTPAIKEAGVTGRRLVPLAQATAGDLILFDFPGDGVARTQHVGICVTNSPRARTITCIEGNTSPGNRGSQANGGGVFQRTRPWMHVSGVVRPRYATPTPTTTTASKPAGRTSPPPFPGTSSPGDTGPATRAYQARLKALGWSGLVVDGIHGKITTRALAAFQRAHGLVADGIGGQRTWAELWG